MEQEGLPEWCSREAQAKLPEESREEELQEYFNVAIPRLIELIRTEGVTHVLLLEKTARIFKQPLISLFNKLGLDVSVGSFSPDYFDREAEELEHVKAEKKKKLRFLPTPSETNKILILDEFCYQGRTITKAKKGMVQLGFREEDILVRAFDGKDEGANQALHPTGLIEEVTVCRNENHRNTFNKDFIFQPDDDEENINHPRLIEGSKQYDKAVRIMKRVVMQAGKVLES